MARFEEEEVRAAVWEYGSAKCLGLDGLNFKFIKEFRDVIKWHLSEREQCIIHGFDP